MRNIRKGDQVVVISGSDKGKQGRVMEVMPKKNKVLVEGVARVTRHTKVQTTDRGGTKGGIETYESPINISNVMLVDSSAPVKAKKYTRVGFEYDINHKKHRVSKQTARRI